MNEPISNNLKRFSEQISMFRSGIIVHGSMICFKIYIANRCGQMFSFRIVVEKYLVFPFQQAMITKAVKEEDENGAVFLQPSESPTTTEGPTRPGWSH